MRNQSHYLKVRAFHRAFGLALDNDAARTLLKMWSGEATQEEILDAFEGSGLTEDELSQILELRADLIDEEWAELESAETLENWIKEAVDLVYVIMGTFATLGIDFDLAFNEVHASNMSKLGEDGKPIHREDGKVLKGPNYKPADMKRFI